jgi:hypothetical protein
VREKTLPRGFIELWLLGLRECPRRRICISLRVAGAESPEGYSCTAPERNPCDLNEPRRRRGPRRFTPWTASKTPFRRSTADLNAMEKRRRGHSSVAFVTSSMVE